MEWNECRSKWASKRIVVPKWHTDSFLNKNPIIICLVRCFYMPVVCLGLYFVVDITCDLMHSSLPCLSTLKMRNHKHWRKKNSFTCHPILWNFLSIPRYVYEFNLVAVVTPYEMCYLFDLQRFFFALFHSIDNMKYALNACAWCTRLAFLLVEPVNAWFHVTQRRTRCERVSGGEVEKMHEKDFNKFSANAFAFWKLWQQQQHK